MRSHVVVLLGCLSIPTLALSDTGVGHPFPALSSECTPAIPGISCPNEDPLGLGRVELYSGEYFLDEQDLRIAGRGFDFVMQRSYRSRGERVMGATHFMQWQRPLTTFGYGWDFSYNIWLESVPMDTGLGCATCGTAEMPVPCTLTASAIRVHMGNGRTQLFVRTLSQMFADTNGDHVQGPGEPCQNPWLGEYIAGDFHDDQWMRIVEEPPDSRTSPTSLGGFTLEFGDGSRWHFKTHVREPTDFCESCTPYTTGETLEFQDTFRAACDWIEDPNGNRMHLLYEWSTPRTPWGQADDVPRLSTVVDTLGRTVEFVNGNASIVPGHPELGTYRRLEKLVDWTGREVLYTYDDEHRLSAVTSPIVTGTPRLDDATSTEANDFPDGKKRSYEYTRYDGLPSQGNLERIADAAGRALVELEYSRGIIDFVTAGSCECPDEIVDCLDETSDYNRVTRHVIGGSSIWFDYVRLPNVSLPDFGVQYCRFREILRSTVTDAMGNVTVSHFNHLNLVTRRREYVGRANPEGPARTAVRSNGGVEFTENPPTYPLRSTDPSQSPGLKQEYGAWFYETVTDYNSAGLPRHVYGPQATASSSMTTGPRIEYAYAPTAQSLSHVGCGADLDTMPSGFPGVMASTRGMPRVVVRQPGATFESGDEQCLTSFSQYESDDLTSPSIGMEGRALVGMTDHHGEPILQFTHDEHGNEQTKSHGWPSTTAVLLENYEYDDISVPDALVPGGTRTVRRLSAFVHPAHVVGGNPYRQRDEYLYYDDTDCPDPLDSSNAYCSMVGFLKAIVVDANGEHRTTTVEYDALGRVVLQVDPAGNEILSTWNALDQVLRQETHWKHPDGSPGTPMRTDTHFDLHDRPVRTDVRRLGLAGTTDQDDPRATTITRYDILGRPIALLVELEPCPESLLHDLEHRDDWEDVLEASADRGRIAYTKTVYGKDGKVARIEHPEATLGHQPGSVENREHDERGMLFRTTVAPGKPEALVTQQDYDGNGNPIRITVGVGTSEPQVSTNTYDGYDRLRVTTDAMGNERHRSYIHGSLVSREWVMGQEVDVEGNTGTKCLSATRVTYDDQWRPIEQAVALFDDPPATCDDLYDDYPDGWARTSQELTLRGPAISSKDALENVTTFELDTLGRVKRSIGPTGDWTEVTYDANSVPVLTVSWQQSDLGLPPVSFSTSVTADSLGRVVESFDVAGHVSSTDYAEGTRVLRTTDALGFEVLFDYDTAGRLLATRRDLWQNETFIRQVVTHQLFDQDGRLVSQSDDASNATAYEFDSRGRLTDTVLPDGARYTSILDAFGNVVTSIDPNGNEINQRYDRLNRRLRRDSVVECTGAAPATEAEVFSYDGLGRMVAHGREDLAGRRVVIEHDSRGNVISEIASDDGIVTFSARHVFDDRGSRRATCYEASGSQVRYVRDSVGRLREELLLEDWTPAMACGTPDPAERLVVAHDFTGPRILRRTYGNGVVMDFERDDDLLRKEDIVSRPKSGGGMEEVYRRTYFRDVLHQRAFLGKTELHEIELLEKHDSLRRLIESDHQGGELVEYHLDGVGNRELVRTPSVTDWYAMTGQEDLNQYVAAGDIFLAYDPNGNVTARVPVTGDPRPAVHFTFDAYNRPGQAMVGAGIPFDIVSIFGYDALNRRVSKASEGAVTASASYFHDGEALVEERDGATGDVTLRIYGGWALDDLVLQVREGERTWVTTDLQASVVKAFDDDAELVEQFSYDDFGRPTRATEIDGEFSAATSSSAGLSQLFDGAWYDWELGLYWMRTRYMDPDLGRFLSRDSAGVWADAASMGNGYTYAANNPGTFVDPLGLAVGIANTAAESDPNRGNWLPRPRWDRLAAQDDAAIDGMQGKAQGEAALASSTSSQDVVLMLGSLPTTKEAFWDGIAGTDGSGGAAVQSREWAIGFGQGALGAAESSMGFFLPFAIATQSYRTLDSVLEAEGEGFERVASRKIEELRDSTRPVQARIIGGLTFGAMMTVAVSRLPGLPATSPRVPIGARQSALREASEAAFKAARNADDFVVGAKHLPGAGGRFAKFAEGVNPNSVLREALESPAARFFANDETSFKIVTNLGRQVGSKGQTGVRAVVDFNGHVVTWFPVNP